MTHEVATRTVDFVEIAGFYITLISNVNEAEGM